MGFRDWHCERFHRDEFEQGGRHFGRGGRHGHGGLRRRMFGQGDLRFVVLKLIEEKPRHGYEIIKEIEERLGGAYSPSPGVIYPTLTLLEEMGLVSMEADEAGKKLYAITDAGRAELASNRDLIASLFERMSAAIGGRGFSSAPILRAMQNLKMALRFRLARGQLSEAQIAAIAATLDRAATEIEQI